MAVTRLNNIHPKMLEWAYRRAGFTEEKAVKAFPELVCWLSGEKLPTVNQLQQFARRFYVPFGYLFLHEVPAETIPFPMFRGEAGDNDHFDLNVYDTVNHIRNRQDWLAEYLTENEIDTCQLVNSITLQTPIGEAVNLLRRELALDPRWAFCLARTDIAVGLLTEKLEQAGFFVAYNGVVGNNTQRALKVSECRGFALVNEVAPYIFVNSADSKSAQLFTLVHEAAHIMLGVSAGHAGEEMMAHDAYENYCDRFAAEFLVPADVLRETWNGDIKKHSRHFKASEIVVARRAHDLNLLSDAAYRSFWMEYSHRPISAPQERRWRQFLPHQCQESRPPLCHSCSQCRHQPSAGIHRGISSDRSVWQHLPAFHDQQYLRSKGNGIYLRCEHIHPLQARDAYGLVATLLEKDCRNDKCR